MEINEATASRENANIGILLPLIFIPKHPKRLTSSLSKAATCCPVYCKIYSRGGSILSFHLLFSSIHQSANILFVNHNEERKTVSLRNEHIICPGGRGGGGGASQNS